MRLAVVGVLVAASLAGCSLLIDLDSVRPGAAVDAATDGAPDASTGLAVSVPASVRVRAGGMTTLAVTITRGPEVGDVAVDVELTALPIGAAAPAIQIPPGATTGMLQLSVNGGTAQGDHDVVVVARAAGTADAQAITDLIVAGAPGTPDLSFGTDGVMTSPVFTSVTALAVTPAGRIYVLATSGAGDRLAALGRTGGLDPGFSLDGVVELDVAGDAVLLRGVGALVAGDAPGGMVGLRAFAADGSPDATFGGDGTVDRASTAVVSAGLASDGTIYTVSTGLVARYLADGTFDDELAVPAIPLRSVGAQTTGKIVAGSANPNGYPVVHRVQVGAGGLELDPSFGAGGSRQYGPPTGMGFGQSFFSQLAIGADDRIVVTGFDEAPGNGIFVAAVAADAPMTSLYWATPAADSGTGRDVVTAAQDRVVIVGDAGASPGSVVIRTSGATLDPSFAGDGSFEHLATLRVVTLQPDGRILAAGDQTGQGVIVRLWD